MKKDIADLLDSLTLDDARKYDALVDKVVWIQDTFLDPNDLDRDWWTAVEETLIDILEAYKEEN
jgi:hypothetical protein